MRIEQILRGRQGTILDVRTIGEFQSGHVAGSNNIPLQELTGRLDEVNALPQPLVLCCASGGRSGQAEAILTGIGVDCINGGSWLNVNRIVNNLG